MRISFSIASVWTLLFPVTATRSTCTNAPRWTQTAMSTVGGEGLIVDAGSTDAPA
jgi:hypothetical protein